MLRVQEYTTVADLNTASLEALTLCGIKVKDAQALHNHLHPGRGISEVLEGSKWNAEGERVEVGPLLRLLQE